MNNLSGAKIPNIYYMEEFNNIKLLNIAYLEFSNNQEIQLSNLLLKPIDAYEGTISVIHSSHQSPKKAI